jgi:hypothetical protein
VGALGSLDDDGEYRHNSFMPFNGAAAIERAIMRVIMVLGPEIIVLPWEHGMDINR